MPGFFEQLGISVITRIVGVVCLIAGAVFVYWWFFGPKSDKPIELKRALDWRAEHLRQSVVRQAVETILLEAPPPGTPNSILLAPFVGDDKFVELRVAIRNALLTRGYNRGEVRLLRRRVEAEKPPPAGTVPPSDTPPASGWLERLQGWLPSLTAPETDDTPPAAADEPQVLFYVEGRVGGNIHAEAPHLELSLEAAAATKDRRTGQWRRDEDKVELDTLAEHLTPGTLAYAQVWMANTSAVARLAAWLVFVGGLPWLTASLIRAALQSQSNAAGLLVVGGYTILAAVAAWAAIGLNLAGLTDWLLWLTAIALAGLYNVLMGEWLEEWARD